MYWRGICIGSDKINYYKAFSMKTKQLGKILKDIN